MPETIVPQEGDTVTNLLEYYATFLADYRCRMTPRQADKFIGKTSNTIRGAIERKEIRYRKNGSRYEVTPLAIAEWLDKYDRPIEPEPLPG